MHFLWVKTDLLHPTNSGGRIRTFEMLREIHRNHQVSYLSLDDGRTSPDAIARSSEYARSLELVPQKRTTKQGVPFYADLARNLVSSYPYVLDRYKSPMLSSRISEICRTENVDVLVCDFLFPAPAVRDDVTIPRVLFQHNVEARIWERHAQVGPTPVHKIYFGMQHRRMVRAERELCAKFDEVIAVSEEDARAFRTEYGTTNVSSVPTGVNTDFFGISDPSLRQKGNIVFLGSMDWMPNIDGVKWFIQEVLPLVRRDVPEATVTVVGRDPAPAIVALGNSVPGVRVTGTVDDVRPYLSAGALFVVPLRVGGGTRLKLYEGMSTGIGTVSTTVGAEGLPIVDGTHIRLADDTASMAATVTQMLQSPDATNRMGLAAADFVRSRFGWASVAQSFVDLCEQTRDRVQKTRPSAKRS